MHLMLVQQTVNSLRLRVRKLRQPMKFKQVDRSIIGGMSASYLTEPVSLRMESHKGTIEFVVTPEMAEVMILGYWLLKWSPTVY